MEENEFLEALNQYPLRVNVREELFSESPMLLPKTESIIKITLKVLKSQIEETIEAPTSENVFKLKSLFELRTGIPIQAQTLVFKGKVMHDDKILANYGLRDGDKLHVTGDFSHKDPPFWSMLKTFLLEFYDEVTTMKIISHFSKLHIDATKLEAEGGSRDDSKKQKI